MFEVGLDFGKPPDAIGDALVRDRADILADDLAANLALVMPIHTPLRELLSERAAFIERLVELGVETPLQQLCKHGLGGETDLLHS